MPLDVTPTLAAVKYEAGFDINRLILEVVTDLQARGRLIGGILQEFEAGGDPSCLRLKVVDVRTRKAVSIRQDRGRDGQGCKLDPSGLVPGIAYTVAAGIPLLTTVREPYLDGWRSFHGGLAIELAPRKRAIIEWCDAACRAPAIAGHAPCQSD